MVHFINSRTIYLRSIVASGNGQPNLNTKLIGKIRIPLPPTRDEQEAIADALSDADALIESLEQLLVKKRQLKQGAMQQLLKGKKRVPGFEVNPGYMQTELGLLPKDWNLREVGTVGNWFSGTTPSLSVDEYWSGDIPWVSPKDMKTLRMRDSIDHITANAVRAGARLVPAGTILIVVRGMILAHSFPVARAECSLAFNQDIKAVVTRKDIDSRFLLYWFLTHTPNVRNLTTESTHGTKRIPMEMLFRELIACPSIAEQEAIATILSDMDAEIDALEAKLTKARQIKQGMMQELLTGRIRLV